MNTADEDHTVSTREQQAIDACLGAYTLCRKTAAYALQDGGSLAKPYTLKLLNDCADVALATANLLTRASPFKQHLASLCATIARSCADVLAPEDDDDLNVRAAYAACCHAADACTALFAESEAEPSNGRHEALVESFPASDPAPPPTEL